MQTQGIERAYGTTADGFQAARLGDFSYVAVPESDRLRIATAWRQKKPLEDTLKADFDFPETTLAAGELFHTFIERMALHMNQKAALKRREGFERTSTPWGMSDSATHYAEGIICYGTPSHGGFWLSDARKREMPRSLGKPRTWYEEDCDWCFVALGFPGLFTDRERDLAEATLRNYYPDIWEKHFNRVLQPGESNEKDRRLFHQLHIDDMIVVSATRCNEDPTTIIAYAAKGGDRTSETHAYRVPRSEYSSSGFGFVIQPHHERIAA